MKLMEMSTIWETNKDIKGNDEMRDFVFSQNSSNSIDPIKYYEMIGFIRKTFKKEDSTNAEI